MFRDPCASVKMAPCKTEEQLLLEIERRKPKMDSARQKEDRLRNSSIADYTKAKEIKAAYIKIHKKRDEKMVDTSGVSDQYLDSFLTNYRYQEGAKERTSQWAD